MDESTTISVRAAADVLGVSKTHLYDLARTQGYIVPGLPFLTIGSCRRLPRARLLAYASGEWVPDRAEVSA